MPYSIQDTKKPLYPEIIWNKPETKALAGKLLIIGGNVHAITAPSTAYALALDAGAGEVKVVMPAATKRYFAHSTIPLDIMFAESTPSGSFSTAASDVLMQYLAWADYVFIAGDVSKNSETAMMLVDVIKNYSGPICITGDALDALLQEATTVLQRHNTLIVPSFTMLQKYTIKANHNTALISNMLLKSMAEWLADFSNTHAATILFAHHNNAYSALLGEVIISTPISYDGNWELRTATTASVWAMQHPATQFKAIATSVTQLGY